MFYMFFVQDGDFDGKVTKYQDLVVWQKSMQLVKEVYKLVRLLPKGEKYALGDQMRRAAVSIPSNIAEGYGRNYDKELIQFLYISRGSKSELETQIEISIMLGYFSREEAEASLDLCSEVGKMLNAFLSSLKNK